MPYESFTETAKCLDKKRCFKQLVEASQILKVLKLSREGAPGQKIGWQNHPAVLQWVGYELALQVYYNAFYDWCVSHWGIKTVKLKRIEFEEKFFFYPVPKWLGYEPLHASHRGRLLDKDFEFYSKYGWKETPISAEVGYLWGNQVKTFRTDYYHIYLGTERYEGSSL